MRELEFLHYHPGTGFWHRHDPRLKLMEMAAWSVLALLGNPWTLAVTGTVLLFLLIFSGTRLRRLVRPFLFWLAMASVIALAAGLGDDVSKVSIAGYRLPFGRTGLLSGLLRALRLLVVLLAGQLLAATTDPADLAGAIRRLTSFLPRTWSASLASTISLTLSFLPIILDQAAIVRDASLSRGIANRRSPLRRALSFGFPMAELTLRQADLTAEALISRGFVADPTDPEMVLTRKDLLTFLLVILLPALGETLEYLPVS